MKIKLVPVEPEEIVQYKTDMQKAFQNCFKNVFGKTEKVILPEKDIDRSLNANGAAAYKAVADGIMVGGAVVINEKTHHNHLDLLFVKTGTQGNGIGKKIWFELERMYPRYKSVGNLYAVFRQTQCSFLCKCLWLSYYRAF